MMSPWQQLEEDGLLIGGLDVGPLTSDAVCSIPLHADDEYGDIPAYLSPEVARLLAAELIALADEADRRVTDGEFGVLHAVATLERWVG